MNSKLGFLKPLFFIALPVFILHYLVFHFSSWNDKQEEFYYSIPFLYLLYFIFSKTTLFIIHTISKKNFDNTGMSFMIITSIKMAISYFIVKPILEKSDEVTFEKLNFFFIFILFLAIETIATILILNKKQ